MKVAINKINNCFACLSEPVKILTRISLGIVFVGAGWGKLNNLNNVIGFFDSLGIPFAFLQAPFVAGLEFVGGIFLILGLFTRISSVLLLFVMIVAILTAKLSDIESLKDLLTLYEFTYVLLFAYLAAYGAGKISIDHRLKL